MMRARMAAHWDMRLGCANAVGCLAPGAAAESLIIFNVAVGLLSEGAALRVLP